MIHILLDTNGYVDMYTSIKLVHEIYLNSTQSHLLNIDYEKLLCIKKKLH